VHRVATSWSRNRERGKYDNKLEIAFLHSLAHAGDEESWLHVLDDDNVILPGYFQLLFRLGASSTSESPTQVDAVCYAQFDHDAQPGYSFLRKETTPTRGLLGWVDVAQCTMRVRTFVAAGLFECFYNEGVMFRRQLARNPSGFVLTAAPGCHYNALKYNATRHWLTTDPCTPLAVTNIDHATLESEFRQ